MNEFTSEEYKIIQQAVKYYQIHGVNFNSKEYNICSSVFDKIVKIVYNKGRKQS